MTAERQKWLKFVQNATMLKLAVVWLDLGLALLALNLNMNLMFRFNFISKTNAR